MKSLIGHSGTPIVEAKGNIFSTFSKLGLPRF